MTRLPLLQYDTSKTVLHLLGCRVRCSIENTVAIVKPGTDDTGSECLGNVLRQHSPNMLQCPYVVLHALHTDETCLLKVRLGSKMTPRDWLTYSLYL